VKRVLKMLYEIQKDRKRKDINDFIYTENFIHVKKLPKHIPEYYQEYVDIMRDMSEECYLRETYIKKWLCS